MAHDRSQHTMDHRRCMVVDFLSAAGWCFFGIGIVGLSNAIPGTSLFANIWSICMGAPMIILAAVLRRDFSMLIPTLFFYLSVVLLLFGSVRLLRLAFGTRPWALLSEAGVVPAGLSLAGLICVYFAMKRLSAADRKAQ